MCITCYYTCCYILSFLLCSQHHSPVTAVTALCGEAREAAQKLLNHYVKVHIFPPSYQQITIAANGHFRPRPSISLLTPSLLLWTGSGPDHIPDAEKECGDTRLGQHHRTTECPCCDEESGGGYHLY